MCRCLGLALMKHIESSKDKYHVIELINTNEKFDFFNTIFNINFDYFDSFFNLQNKISNLDKLDSKYRIEENGTGVNLKDFNFVNEENIKKKQESQISYTSHMNYNDVSEVLNEDKKEKDTRVISDYFKMTDSVISNKNIPFQEKYKNVADGTKIILCQDLTSINEVDSMEFVKSNLLFTIDQKKVKKQATDFIDLLQESATNFLTENENKKVFFFNF